MVAGDECVPDLKSDCVPCCEISSDGRSVCRRKDGGFEEVDDAPLMAPRGTDRWSAVMSAGAPTLHCVVGFVLVGRSRS